MFLRQGLRIGLGTLERHARILIMFVHIKTIASTTNEKRSERNLERGADMLHCNLGMQ